MDIKTFFVNELFFLFLLLFIVVNFVYGFYEVNY